MSEEKNFLENRAVMWGAFGVVLIIACVSICIGGFDFSLYDQKFLPLPVDLGAFKIVVIFFFAIIQAVLIAALFLGLGKSKVLPRAIFLSGVMVMVVFTLLTLSDTLFRGTANPIESERMHSLK